MGALDGDEWNIAPKTASQVQKGHRQRPLVLSFGFEESPSQGNSHHFLGLSERLPQRMQRELKKHQDVEILVAALSLVE